MGKIVSIRCRRHKKRFNVKSDWLKTCKWLCPQCYNKLTANERKKYAPRSGEEVEVRQAESGKSAVGVKPSQRRSVKKSHGSFIGDFLDRRNGSKKSGIKDICHDIDRAIDTILSEPPPNPCKGMSNSTSYSFRSELDALKPQYTIHCQKCGEDYPCHYFWFNKSKVLCPACAADMTSEQIEEYNRTHFGTLPAYKKPPAITEKKVEKPRAFIDYWGDNTEIIETGKGCSEYFIRHATKKDLLDAVKLGKLSKIRAKIELKRRESSEYFDDMPEVEFGRF